jgi:hypothetical protein
MSDAGKCRGGPTTPLEWLECRDAADAMRRGSLPGARLTGGPGPPTLPPGGAGLPENQVTVRLAG